MKGKEKGNTGKRYTEAQKKRVLDFISSQGRGGIAAAQKKFGVSYIAVRRWLDGKGGVPKKTRNTNNEGLMELRIFKKALKAFAAKL